MGQCVAPHDGDKLTNYLTMLGHICSDINQGALSAVLPFLVVDGGTFLGYGW